MKTQPTFKDGTPAPFVQQGEQAFKIQLNPGVPPLGTPEFEAFLKEAHERLNDRGRQTRLTTKGRMALKDG